MLEFELCREDAAEVAECYCLDRLSEIETEAFEEHYLGCRRCAVLVQEADQYARAMRAAAILLNPALGADLGGAPSNN
jgi:hypothetical protein